MLRRFRIPFATLLMLGLSATALHAGKPGSNPPPPPPQPIKYQVQFWNVPGGTKNFSVLDTNNSGQTVGYYTIGVNSDGITLVQRAFLYDPDVNTLLAFDLNDIGVIGLEPGWTIREAKAINEVGQIAVAIVPINDLKTTFVQSAIIDLNQTPPTLYTIDDEYVYSAPGDINDWGDMVVKYKREDGSFGHYVTSFDLTNGFSRPVDLLVVTSNARGPRINNMRDIVGSRGTFDAYRTTWDGQLTWNGQRQNFSGLIPYSLNENGEFSGTAIVSTGKGKNSTTNYAFVHGVSTDVFTDMSSSLDLNESQDFVNPSYLYHRNYGKLAIKDLLDTNHPDSSLLVTSTFMECYTMTDRVPGTDFPVLTGYAIVGGMPVFFQLFPVAAP